MPAAGSGRWHKLATYFVTDGGLQSFYEWINPQLVTLRAGGRMFAHRTHVNTDGYRLERVLSFPGVSAVPTHVVGDHPFAGLFVAYLDASGARAANDRAADEAATLPAGTLALSLRPNAGSLSAASIGLAAAQPGMDFPAVGGAPVRLLLAFLTEAPLPTREWSADMARRAARLTGSAAIWGGGFCPVVPGSRAHLAHLR